MHNLLRDTSKWVHVCIYVGYLIQYYTADWRYVPNSLICHVCTVMTLALMIYVTGKS